MAMSSNKGTTPLTTVSMAISDACMALADANAILSAFHSCKTDSVWKGSVQRYEANLLKQVAAQRRQILSGKFSVSPYYEFDIFERGKPRHIQALTVPDRVFMREFCDLIVMPAIMPHLIYDNSSSIQYRGINFARRRFLCHLQKFYREHKTNKGYILQIDFSKFFDSLDHEKLYEAFCKVIPDEYCRLVIRKSIDSFPGDKGVGIGSQLSQCAGIFYPSPIDHYCKTVKSCRYYGRYMDDIYVVHHDKAFLQALLSDICRIATELALSINSRKTHISPLRGPFTFLKSVYKLFPTGRILYTPVRATVVRMRRKLKKLHRMGKLALADARNLYRSWRNGLLVNFPRSCYKTVKSMDRLFFSLYGVLP